MSEVEKTLMDKRNTSTSRQQLALPSPRPSNDNGASANRYPVPYQKNGSVSSDSTSSKKYLQPREKNNFKGNGNGIKKFGADQTREFNGASSTPNEFGYSRKFSQARERGFDKRMLAQGSPGGNSQGRRNGSGAKGGMSNYEQNPNGGAKPWREKNFAHSRYGFKVPYKKEQFLQANCQFVVRENGDYAVHASNPDTLVDWDLVEQVRIFGHEVPSCPICLYPPKAAKITRCGHSYCWPCMLHYMSTCEEDCVRCPICFDRVREKDLKSVVSLQTICYGIGHEITMRLMKKSRGQTLIAPRPIWNSDLKKPFSVSDEESVCYAKLLTADLDFIQKLLDAEREELVFLLQEENADTLEGSFVTAALKSLEERMLILKSGDMRSDEPSEPTLHLNNLDDVSAQESPGVLSSTECKVSKRYASAFSDEEEELSSLAESNIIVEEEDDGSGENHVNDEGVEAISMTESTPGHVGEENSIAEAAEAKSVEPRPAMFHKHRKERDDSAYFYQSADGQHIYLHGLNVTCLKAQYGGDLSNCPDELSAKIVDLEHIFMDEEFRRKYRWLNHLPLTCEFIMAELDLKPPLVSQEVLDNYADDIVKRQHERERKLRYDNRRTQRIQKEESRKMGYDNHSVIVRSDFKRGVRPTSASAIEAIFSSLPSAGGWSANQRQPAFSDSSSVDTNTAEDVAEVGVSRDSTSSEENPALAAPAVPSFAQMLKMGSPKPASFGARGKSTPAAEDKGDLKSDNSDGEEFVRPPTFQYDFMCGIGEKLAEMDRVAACGPEEAPVGGGKKKKKSKMVLFSSGHKFNGKL